MYIKLPVIALFLLLLNITLPAQSISLFPVIENGKWGYINPQGKTVIPPQFDYALPFSEGMGRIADKNRRYGFVNTSGKVVVSPKFVYADDFTGGLARVRLGDRYGFIDKNGRFAVSPRFEYAENLREERALVKENGLYGFIDNNGKIVISPQFTEASHFHQGLAPVKAQTDDGRELWGYITKAGRYYISPRFYNIRHYSDSMAAVVTNMRGLWGFIDAKGKVIIPPQFNEVKDFQGNIAAVRRATKWGYIDKSGETVIPFKFDTADDFINGIARVNTSTSSSPYSYSYSTTRRWGYINTEGEYIIEPQFAWGAQFDRDIARVIKGTGWGYINRAGNYKIDDRIEYAYDLIEGRACVKVSGRYGYLDKTGRLAIPIRYIAAGDFNNGLAKVLRQEGAGFVLEYIDTRGKAIWQTRGTLRRIFSNGDTLYVTATPRQPSTNEYHFSGMELFREPDLNSRIITTLPYGAKVTAKDTPLTNEILLGDGLTGLWLKVEYMGRDGFVFDAYLSKLPPPPEETPEPPLLLEEYFDRVLGVIREPEPQDPHRRASDTVKLYGMGVEMRQHGSGRSAYSTFKIPYFSVQEAFVIIKNLLDFHNAQLPRGYSRTSRGRNSFAVTATRQNNRLSRLTVNYYSPSGSRVYTVWREGDNVFIRENA